MTGSIKRNGIAIQNPASGGLVELVGDSNGLNDKGGTLFLFDKGHSTYPGLFLLRAADNGTYSDLKGGPQGQLLWRGKNIVRSAVTTSGTADANGNLSQGVLFTG